MQIYFRKLDGVRINANWTSDSILMDMMTSLSIQGVIRAASTAAGTFTLEGSINNSNWETLTSSGGVNVSKAVTTNDTFLWDMLGTAVKWVRIKYTSSSGDGYIDIWLNGKECV